MSRNDRSTRIRSTPGKALRRVRAAARSRSHRCRCISYTEPGARDETGMRTPPKIKSARHAQVPRRTTRWAHVLERQSRCGRNAPGAGDWNYPATSVPWRRSEMIIHRAGVLRSEICPEAPAACARALASAHVRCTSARCDAIAGSHSAARVRRRDWRPWREIDPASMESILRLARRRANITRVDPDLCVTVACDPPARRLAAAAGNGDS